MTADDVLDLLAARRVAVYLRAGELRCAAPAGAYTDDLRRLVDQHRPALRAALAERPTQTLPPAGWHDEVRHERRVLLGRMALCDDPAVRGRLAGLAADQPRDEASA